MSAPTVVCIDLAFLLAAKRREIAEREQLGKTAAWVNATAELIHALQRERGFSNLYLGHPQAVAATLATQHAATDSAAEALLVLLRGLNDEDGGLAYGSRPLSRIAYAWHGQRCLPALRQQVLQRQWAPQRATRAYSHLIAAWLAVIFDAADSATDPQTSRLLIALFNLMQGKELAGQERATGVFMLSDESPSPHAQRALDELIEGQEHYFDVFAHQLPWPDNAVEDARAAIQPSAEHERMRRLLCSSRVSCLSTENDLRRRWFELCSARIDRLRELEQRLCDALRRMCVKRIEDAQRELHALQAEPLASERREPSAARALEFFEDATATQPVVPQQPLQSHLQRSLLEMLQEQRVQLQRIEQELEAARAGLQERKTIERAKGLLMARRGMSEDEAYRRLRQLAMAQRRRLVDVAEMVLTAADLLPPAAD